MGIAGTHVSALITIQDVAGVGGTSYPVNDVLEIQGGPIAGEVVSIWRWDITGPGVIPSANTQDIIQQFNTPGIYQITLTTTEADGTQRVENQAITITNDQADWGVTPNFTYAVDRITESSTLPLDVSLIDQSQLGIGRLGSSSGEVIVQWRWVIDNDRVIVGPTPGIVQLTPIDSGIHTIGLRIDTNLGRSAFIQNAITIPPVLAQITPADCGLVANSLIAQQNEQDVPLEAPITVQFGAQPSIRGMDETQSVPLIESWEWDFGTNPVTGQQITSLEQNPVIRFENVGTYHPRVRYHLYNGIDSPWFEFQTAPTIYPDWFDQTVPLTGNFNLGPHTTVGFYWETLTTNPTAGYLVQFFDTSFSQAVGGMRNGIILWNWNFGDGEIEVVPSVRSPVNPNDLVSVTHLYKEPGQYHVTLDVTAAEGIITRGEADITVNPGYTAANMRTGTPTVTPGAVTAGFATVASFNTISFIDTSTGPVTSWQWNFGDGTANSTAENPVHVYATGTGSYLVTLTVSDVNGVQIDTTTQRVGIRDANPLPDVNVSSTAFSNLGAIPARFTCDGTGISPPVSWNFIPPGTQSFVLIMHDLDADFTHWVLYNIPGTATSIPENIPTNLNQLSDGTMQGVNDWGGALGYGVPCPPANAHHRYQITVFAINQKLPNLVPGTRAQVLAQIAGSIVGTGNMIGIYR